MSNHSNELYSLLVPLGQERLIVPRACVAEVVGYRPTAERLASAPAWLLGRMNWNGRLIPLLSFEGACGLETPEPSNRTRVVVFYVIGGELDSGYYGILTQGFPQLVRVNPDVLQPEDKEWPASTPVICQLRMINEYPLVPHLEQLETMICEALNGAASAVPG